MKSHWEADIKNKTAYKKTSAIFEWATQSRLEPNTPMRLDLNAMNFTKLVLRSLRFQEEISVFILQSIS